MKTILRMAAAGASVITVTAACVLFTGTAQATAAQCEDYLQYIGYTVTPQMREGCWMGAHGFTLRCEDDLFEENVIAGHAVEACQRAYWH